MRVVRKTTIVFVTFGSISVAGCGDSERGSTFGAAGGMAGTGGGAGSAGSGGTQGGAAGASGSSSNAGRGGSIAGSAGTTSSAGTGGFTFTDCPNVRPIDGSSCSMEDLTCGYDECPVARTVATCLTTGTWELSSSDCFGFACRDRTCAAGQLCLLSGMELIPSCVGNSCGLGPITCECAVPGCVPCNILGNSDGFTVICP